MGPAWTGADAQITWQGDLVFRVDGEMSCAPRRAGPRARSLSSKGDLERFREPAGQPGRRAPCLTRVHRVELARSGALADAGVRVFVRRSCELVRAKSSEREQKAVDE